MVVCRRVFGLIEIATWFDRLTMSGYAPRNDKVGTRERRTGVGEVTVIGVCIPYSRSRVGPRWNRKMWQDHRSTLLALPDC